MDQIPGCSDFFLFIIVFFEGVLVAYVHLCTKFLHRSMKRVLDHPRTRVTVVNFYVSWESSLDPLEE